MPAWIWDLWFVVVLESWLVHVNFMTLLTSSHFILSIRGVSKCVLHAPGSLIKCRGSLVVRPPGMPECLQNLRDFMLPEADFAQAPQQKHPSKSRWYSDFARLHFQDSPELLYRFFVSRTQGVIHVSMSRTFHLHIHTTRGQLVDQGMQWGAPQSTCAPKTVDAWIRPGQSFLLSKSCSCGLLCVCKALQRRVICMYVINTKLW